MPPFVFLVGTPHHDVEHVIRKRSLQRLRLIPRRAHPDIALLVGGQDHRHYLRVDRLHDRVRRPCQASTQGALTHVNVVQISDGDHARVRISQSGGSQCKSQPSIGRISPGPTGSSTDLSRCFTSMTRKPSKRSRSWTPARTDAGVTPPDRTSCKAYVERVLRRGRQFQISRRRCRSR
jgi:hypothetical protein